MKQNIGISNRRAFPLDADTYYDSFHSYLESVSYQVATFIQEYWKVFCTTQNYENQELLHVTHHLVEKNEIAKSQLSEATKKQNKQKATFPTSCYHQFPKVQVINYYV